MQIYTIIIISLILAKSLLNIQNQHIQEYITLPFFDQHKDPFDRLIIATAISENLSIVSADEKFKLYGSVINLIEA